MFGDQRTSEKKKNEKDNPRGGQNVGQLFLGLMKSPSISRLEAVAVTDIDLVHSQNPAGFWKDVGSSDGQVSVCVSGCGFWARAASSLFRNGGRVTVETGQHT